MDSLAVTRPVDQALASSLLSIKVTNNCVTAACFFYILTEDVILLQVLIYCVWWINDFTFNKCSWLFSFFKWVHIFFYHKTEDWLWKTFLILTADQSKWNFMVICCICFWIFFYFELGIANVANLWMFFWITHDILTFFWKYVL